MAELIIAAAIFLTIYFLLGRFPHVFGAKLPRTWLCLGGAFVGFLLFNLVAAKVIFHSVGGGFAAMGVHFWALPLISISGAVTGYLLTRWWAFPSGYAHVVPTRVVLRGTAFVLLAILGFEILAHLYLHWTYDPHYSRIPR